MSDDELTNLAAPCWGLPDGYIERSVAAWYEDDVPSVRGITFQPDVYTYARDLALLAGPAQWVVDVGCGYGDKLAALHEEHRSWGYCGVDYGTNLEACRARHDWGTWVNLDLESDAFLVGHVIPSSAVVICADVVEHLRDPRPLLDAFASCRAPVVVLSTPDRDRCYPPGHLGPPANYCHVREWNLDEFATLLDSRGLHVVHAGHTRANDESAEESTSLVVVVPQR